MRVKLKAAGSTVAGEVRTGAFDFDGDGTGEAQGAGFVEPHAHFFDAGKAEGEPGDLGGQLFDQQELRLLDHPAHGLLDRLVVHRIVEIIRRPGLAQVGEQRDVQANVLLLPAFFRIKADDAAELEVGDGDLVHGKLLQAMTKAERQWRDREWNTVEK